jgi:transcriptional regulator
MYVPKQFALDDLASQHDLIDACDFGILVSNASDGLFATHIPMMLTRNEGALGTLYAHVARPNPHAELFEREALAVFSGPHAYVSPTWYSDRSSNVPTWNYSAVHCYGVPKAVEGDALRHLGQMADRYEGGRPNGWRLSELKPQMRETLPRGIVTFRMEITRIEGKAKFSQNKPREERERVIAGLEAAGEAEVVEAMRAALEKV